jgi:hypothetical protein
MGINVVDANKTGPEETPQERSEEPEGEERDGVASGPLTRDTTPGAPVGRKGASLSGATAGPSYISNHNTSPIQ